MIYGKYFHIYIYNASIFLTFTSSFTFIRVMCGPGMVDVEYYICFHTTRVILHDIVMSCMFIG